MPGAYVADATTAPPLAPLLTPVSASLPAWNNVAQLQFRIMTTNASGNDEWVGIDDILISGQPMSSPVPEPAIPFLVGLGLAAALRRARSSRTAR